MMDEVILRVLSGTAEPFERRRLDRWRVASPDNELHFREVSAIWAAAAPRATAPPFQRAAGTGPPSVDTLIEEGEEVRRQAAAGPDGAAREDEATETNGRRGGSASGGVGSVKRAALPWAIAAVLAAVSLGLLIRGGRPPAPLAGTEYVAGSTEASTVSLADGSFVRLDAGSRVRFAVDGARREAWLSGRAFFGVTPDPEHPFIVHTDVGDTRVLGTRFELREDATGLRIVVVEGSVALTSRQGRSAEVGKGQVGTLAGNGDFSVTTPEDVYALLDWEDGLLLFQGTPLAQVAEEVGARFGVRVEADDALSERRLTAWFGDESLEEVVESVCLMVQARCTVDADLVLITR